MDKKIVGITVKKDVDSSEWYTQVVQKAELIEYSSVSGCVVFRPYCYAIWEKIQAFLDAEFKRSGVKNAYFPLLIPEALLRKEASHVEGFSPEVAWVTEAGESKLAERLAIRPTSETIMYENYAKWVQSWRDLPLRLNQWCSVVRWEFKHPVPFLRSREFLWQEGHSAFASREEAEKEVYEILGMYARAFEELLAVPVIKGVKTEKEKFAGALFTTSVETFLPSGKGIQGATSHCLGQNFAKAFNISFLDEKGDKQFVWQNSWGFSTRSIGILILMHGDDKGLVLPPAIAPIKVVIVPILFEKTKSIVLAAAQKLKGALGSDAYLDDRDQYSPGWKFNEWEMKGVPIRIELGPRDVEAKSAVVVRRDTGEKEIVTLEALPKRIDELLVTIQQDMLTRARECIEKNTETVKRWEDFEHALKEKKLIRAPFCDTAECEEEIKKKTEGAKTQNKPLDEQEVRGTCVHCKKPAKAWALFAKAY